MHLESIHQITVIGAGLMGHSIAQEFACAGYDVVIQDINNDQLRHAIQNIETNLQLLVQTGSLDEQQATSAFQRVKSQNDLALACKDADIVIEAIIENENIKKDLFSKLDKLCPARTILASNTSTIIPSKLAAVTGRPDKVLVAHYFNPPHLLPLVELVRHPDTSDQTASTVYALFKAINKCPVMINKECPGFVSNRLQAALFREVWSLIEDDVISAQDIDIVVQNSFGRRYAIAGPIETLELAGWDLALAAAENIVPYLDSSDVPSKVLQQKVANNELGAKTGQGFYPWTPESADAFREKMAKGLLNIAEISEK